VELRRASHNRAEMARTVVIELVPLPNILQIN